MIYDGCHFEFGNFISRNYNLIFVHFNTPSYNALAGEIQSETIVNKRDNTRHLVSTDYEDSPISFDAEIATDCVRAIPYKERRIIEKQIFNKPEYRKLYIDERDDFLDDTIEYVDGYAKRLYLNCRFMNPERIEDGNGLVVGYKFTVECDSGFLTQDAITKKYELENNISHIKVDVDTDTNDYIYPDVVIHMGTTGGDVSIINNTDDSSRITKFEGIGTLATVTMKGSLNYISGQYYEKFVKQNFIRLLDGSNDITIMGDVKSVEITWQNRRFL